MFGCKDKGKVLGIVIISCMILVMVLGCTSATPQTGTTTTPAATAKAPVMFGLIADETGPTAESGRSLAAGVKLAVKEWNDKGGVFGGSPVQVIERDNAGDPTKATTAIKDLISQGIVAGQMGSGTTDTMPIAKACSENGISQGMNAATTALAQKGPDGKVYQFFYGGEATGMAQTALAFSASKGWKRLAIANNNVAWSQAMRDWCKKYFADGNYSQKGMEIIGEVEFDINSKDYSAEVSKLKALKPDAVLNFVYPQPMGVYLRAYNDQGYKVPNIGLWTNMTTAYQSLDKALSAGILYGFNFASTGNPAYTAKYKDLVKMAGEQTTMSWAVGYQGASNLLTAIDSVGPDKKAIREYMATKLYGTPMIEGRPGATNWIHEGVLVNDIPLYTSLDPEKGWAVLGINSKGEIEWVP